MTQSRAGTFACKWASLLALCVCLVFSLSAKPVKSTVSYISSLSATCVNTFTGGDVTEPSTVSDEPEESEGVSNPPTGDDYLKWYVIGMLAGLADLAVVWSLGRRQKSEKDRL